MEMSAALLDAIESCSSKPPLFEPGEPRFWDDPHIAVVVSVGVLLVCVASPACPTTMQRHDDHDHLA